MEAQWRTFYGKVMYLSNMSHSHLSNICYFYELVCESKAPHQVLAELEKRFSGKRLPYYPLISFQQEIDALVAFGYTSGEANADIRVNGVWIGKIKYE